MEKIEVPFLVTLENKPTITERPIVKINFQGIKPKVTESKDGDEPVKTVFIITSSSEPSSYSNEP